MALAHLDVVHPGRRGSTIDTEHRVTVVAQVTDGHRDAVAGTGRTEQDGLLGTTAGATNRTKLEHANGRRPHACRATRVLVRCVAELTRDSARAVS